MTVYKKPTEKEWLLFRWVIISKAKWNVISGISPKTYLVPIASVGYFRAPRNCVALLGESPFGLVRQDLSTLENNARFAA